MADEFKFKSELSEQGDEATIELTITGDIEFGLRQLQLVIDKRLGRTQDPVKRAPGRPVGTTREALAARALAGNGASAG
jgi:hypothetical protein